MKRNAIVIIAASVLVIIGLWYFALYSPLGEDLTAAQTETKTESDKTAGLRTNLARLEAQAKNSSQQEALLRRFGEAIPENYDLAEFILMATDIATDAGVDFTTITPTPPAVGAGGSTSTIALNISVQGSFFQVKNYLTKLEALERLVIIDGISIAAGSGTDGGGTGSTTGSSTGTSSSGETTLSVTLTGRMFTRAAPLGTIPAIPTPGASSTITVPGGSTSSTGPSGSITTGGA